MENVFSIRRRDLLGLTGAAALSAFAGGHVNAKSIVRLKKKPFILYYYANSLKYFASQLEKTADKELLSWPGVGGVYFRLPWAALNPEPNVYNWSLLSGPCKRFADLGLQLSFRVSCSENRAVWQYATPKWVFDEGIKYRTFPSHDPVKGGRRVGVFEPDFGDEKFLAEHKKFLGLFANYLSEFKACVDFVDVGSFGVYGEGHTISSTSAIYPRQVLISHLMMAKEALGEYNIIVNHNMADSPGLVRDVSILEAASKLGMGFRDDSIFVDRNRPFYDDEVARELFSNKQVILETAEMGGSISSGSWDDNLYERAIERYQATNLGVHWYPHLFFSTKRNLVERILDIS